MDLPLSPTQHLVLELTPLFIRQDCEGPCSSAALYLALGPAWTVFPDAEGGGFFVAPKLAGLVARDVGFTDLGSPPTAEVWSETGVQLSLGLDVGYRMVRGPFYLAFVLGGSVGRGWNVPAWAPSTFFSMLDWPRRSRADKWVWDLNPNLVRAGVAF